MRHETFPFGPLRNVFEIDTKLDPFHKGFLGPRRKRYRNSTLVRSQKAAAAAERSSAFWRSIPPGNKETVDPTDYLAAF